MGTAGGLSTGQASATQGPRATLSLPRTSRGTCPTGQCLGFPSRELPSPFRLHHDPSSVQAPAAGLGPRGPTCSPFHLVLMGVESAPQPEIGTVGVVMVGGPGGEESSLAFLKVLRWRRAICGPTTCPRTPRAALLPASSLLLLEEPFPGTEWPSLQIRGPHRRPPPGEPQSCGLCLCVCAHHTALERRAARSTPRTAHCGFPCGLPALGGRCGHA